MDRTDELIRATQLFQSIDRSKNAAKVPDLSAFIQRACRVSSCLDGNETLVRRINKLIERKEFSNDPTVEMQEISTSFESNVGAINKDLTKLKQDCEAYGQGNDTLQHRKLILQFLQKLLSGHINSFKDAVKVHSANVEQRNKRIGGKYGQVSAVSNITSESASKYALFNSASAVASGEGIAISRQQGLRNRYGTSSTQASSVVAVEEAPVTATGGSIGSTADGSAEPAVNTDQAAPLSGNGNSNSQIGTTSAEDAYENDKKYGKPAPRSVLGSAAAVFSGKTSANASTSGGGTSKGSSAPRSSGGMMSMPSQGQQGQGQVQQQRGTYDRYRLRQAEQAESTIAQMGQLFAQMATLVSEQNETIMRIEDDVESGYQETMQAQGHLQNVFDITKGNRSLILKIFALLVVFIFLFLYWT